MHLASSAGTLSARSQRSEQLYGYGWWIGDLAGHRGYYAWGYGGQYLFVVPDLDLVVVTTSSTAVGESGAAIA